MNVPSFDNTRSELIDLCTCIDMRLSSFGLHFLHLHVRLNWYTAIHSRPSKIPITWHSIWQSERFLILRIISLLWERAPYMFNETFGLPSIYYVMWGLSNSCLQYTCTQLAIWLRLSSDTKKCVWEGRIVAANNTTEAHGGKRTPSYSFRPYVLQI